MNAPRLSDQGQTALTYGRLGWPVFPVHSIREDGGCTCRDGRACDSPAKHPRTANGLNDAATDEDTIRDWWQRWPNANIGVRTDAFVVLDVDPRNGGEASLEDLIHDHGRDWLDTLTSLTGGGGQHYIFRAPVGMRIHSGTSKNLPPGIDIRGIGNYIVAPPSVHASGNFYRWEGDAGPDEAEPAALPGWLLELLTGRGALRLVANDQGFVLPKVVDRNRNVTLTSIAGSMRRRGFGENAIVAALLVENDERCDPPLSEREVRRIASSIAQYPPGDAPETPTPLTPAEVDPDSTRYTLHWAREAFLPQPPIEYAIEGLFPRGGIALIVGAPGSKKTFAVLDAALCIALGRPWLGFETTQGTVLIIDEESGTRRLNKRLAEAMRAYDAPDETPIAYTSLEAFNFRSTLDLGYIEQLIKEINPIFVVVDALADVTPGADENSVKDVMPAFLAIKGIADRTQTSFAVIHHANKQGGYRGSTAIAGAVDLMLAVESKPDSPHIDFITMKARDTEPKIFAATFDYDRDEESFRLLASGTRRENKDHLSPAQQAVTQFLVEYGQATVKEIVSGLDLLTPDTVKKSLQRLMAAGRVRKVADTRRGLPATYELVGRF